jgi:hypothetical protein
LKLIRKRGWPRYREWLAKRLNDLHRALAPRVVSIAPPQFAFERYPHADETDCVNERTSIVRKEMIVTIGLVELELDRSNYRSSELTVLWEVQFGARRRGEKGSIDRRPRARTRSPQLLIAIDQPRKKVGSAPAAYCRIWGNPILPSRYITNL